MKFNLCTSGYFYDDAEKRKELEALGFVFENIKETWHIVKTTTIEINSLEELLAFTEKWGDIVLNNDTIEIYDYYRE